MRTHKLARNVTMRVKPDGLHVTDPPYSLSSKVLEVVEQYRQRLLEDWRKVSKKPIDLNFRIHTPCFRLWLEQGNFTCFSVRFTEEGVKIICPRNVDFSLPEVQRLVRNAIIRAMKKNAQEYLPPLLSALSEQYHLPFKRVKITGSRGRWGSCSGTGSINLSCYLMLLPPHSVSYTHLDVYKRQPSTYVPLNATLGFKAYPVNGLWFNVFGGYRISKDELFCNLVDADGYYLSLIHIFRPCRLFPV